MADAREERWEQQGFLRNNKNKLSSVDENRNIGIVSTAIELTFSPIEHLGIALGYGHHWLLRDDDSGDDASTFVAGAHYDLPTDTRLHLSAARKIKIPSINQLYDVGSGDPNLQFEHSSHYEAGAVQQLPGNSEIRIAGFLTDVSNYIEKDNDGIFRNFARYEFQGIEIAAQTYAIDNLMLRTSYTFLHTRERFGGLGRDELQYRPQHKLTFEADYQFGYGFSGYLNVMHVAGEHYYSKNEPVQKAGLDPYTLLNMKLNYNFYRNHAAVYVGADNILDTDYQESVGLPQAGRFVYTGLKLSY